MNCNKGRRQKEAEEPRMHFERKEGVINNTYSCREVKKLRTQPRPLEMSSERIVSIENRSQNTRSEGVNRPEVEAVWTNFLEEVWQRRGRKRIVVSGGSRDARRCFKIKRLE